MAGRPEHKMPISDRAKQFAPFAAVSGLDTLIKQKQDELYNEERRTLFEDSINEIETSLRSIAPGDELTITYYCRNRYVTEQGILESIDEYSQQLVFNGNTILFSDLYSIQKLT